MTRRENGDDYEPRGGNLVKALFVLANLVFGLVSFEFFRATDALEKRVDRSDTKIESLGTESAAHGERLSKLESSEESNQREMSRMLQMLDQINQKIDFILKEWKR